MTFVGPMPVKKFFQKFLPTPLSFPKTEKEKLAGFEMMSAAGIENQMYDEFVRSFSVPRFILHLSWFCPGNCCKFHLYFHESIQHIKNIRHEKGDKGRPRHHFIPPEQTASRRTPRFFPAHGIIR